MQEDLSIWLLDVALMCKMVRPDMFFGGTEKRLQLSLGSGPAAIGSGIQQQILRAEETCEVESGNTVTVSAFIQQWI